MTEIWAMPLQSVRHRINQSGSGYLGCKDVLYASVQKGPKQGRRSVLLVGNPALPLKGFDVAIAVLTMVNRVLPLDVTWICQTQPSAAMVPGLATSGLRINLHISPAQVREHMQLVHSADTLSLTWLLTS